MNRWRQTLRFHRDPFTFLSESRLELGDVFRLDLLGMGRWVMVCSPEMAEAVFRAPDDELSAGRANSRFLGFLLGRDSHVHQDGARQRKRRRHTQRHFLERASLDTVPLVRGAAEERIASWEPGTTLLMLEELKTLSVDVLLRVLFGEMDATTRDRMTVLVRRFFGRGPGSPAVALPFLRRNLGPWSPWGRVERLRTEMRNAFREVVDLRRRQPGEDVLSSLVQAEDDGGPLGDDAILDELTNILFAGTETTSRVMAWAVYGVLAHPEVHRRLDEELAAVLGHARRGVEAEDLEKLEYLTAIIHEAIRNWPLGPFTGVRLVARDCRLGDFALDEGTIVAHCHAEICRRDDLFDRPYRFDPEHFLERKPSSRQWRPFGGGTRMCLGTSLAMVEMRTVLATLFSRCRLSLVEESIRPVRGSFLFEPEKDLPVRFDGPVASPGDRSSRDPSS